MTASSSGRPGWRSRWSTPAPVEKNACRRGEVCRRLPADRDIGWRQLGACRLQMRARQAVGAVRAARIDRDRQFGQAPRQFALPGQSGAGFVVGDDDVHRPIIGDHPPSRCPRGFPVDASLRQSVAITRAVRATIAV